MGVNKVLFGGETVMDISDSTVTPGTLSKGATAYNSAGEKITGTMELTKSGVTTALGYTPVKSVNGKTGESITLSANDVGAVPTSKQMSGNNTFYVDAVNGSDSNNGTSQAKAFATIQKALSSVPANLGAYTLLIYVCSDITLAAGVKITIANFKNGKLEIKSVSETVIPTITGETTGYGNGIIKIESCDADISINKINIKQNGSSSGLFANNSTGFLRYGYSTLTGAKSDGVGTDGNASGVYIYSPMMAVVDKMTISNWYNAGIRSTNSFFQGQNQNNITGNGVGIVANGGVVGGQFTLSGNDSNYTCANGGRIYTGAQTSVPNY